MKKLAFISLITAAVFLLSACALDSFEAYENFVNDMDVIARIEDAFYAVRQGDTSPILRSNVEALYYDLESYTDSENGNIPGDAPLASGNVRIDYAHNVNMDYINSVQLLLKAIDDRRAGDPQKAQLDYEQAINKYNEAQDLYYRFLVQSNRKNR